MNPTKRTPFGYLTIFACGTLLLVVFLLRPVAVMAQWSTDGNGNMSNTNTGNVGVKTTSPPEFPLQVNNSSSNVLGTVYTGTLSPTSGAGIQALTTGTPSAADQRLGFFTFGVRNGGTSYNPIAIQGFSSQSWTLNSAQGGYLTFSTTPNGSITRTERMRIDQNGYVGLGTTAPSSPLTVIAPSGVREGLLLAGAGNTWIYTDFTMIPVGTIATGKPASFAWSLRKDAFYGGDSSGPSMVMEIGRQGGGVYVPFIINPSGNLILAGATNATNGNVGIGTTAPGSKLDVTGRIQQTGSASDLGYLLPNGGLLASTTALNPGIAFYGGNGVNALYGADLGYSATTSRYRTRVFSGNQVSDVAFGRQESAQTNPTQSAFLEFLTVRGDTGNVGIGNPGPAYKLDVSGTINSTSGICISGDCKTAWSQIGSQWSNQAAGISYSSGSVGIGTTNPGALVDLASSTQINNRLLLSGQEYYAPGFSSASGVAIRLGVNRTDERQIWFADSTQALNTTNSQIRMRFYTGSAGLDAITTDGSSFRPLVLQSVGGDVGIGTSSPSYRLDVNGGANGFRAKAASANANDTIASFENNSAIKMIVRADGKVGIGNPSPQKTLDVTGDFNASGTITGGTIQAKYQDVAEWVESSQELPAGTVVVLDSTRSNQVIASSRSYDSHVAGVISLRPGLTLGVQGEGRVLVATTGRVKVKVDASKGPINIGDLLVTSDREGFAMKSVAVELGGIQIHRPGTLIGKALEPLAQGTGEILVLLSLQ